MGFHPSLQTIRVLLQCVQSALVLTLHTYICLWQLPSPFPPPPHSFSSPAGNGRQDLTAARQVLDHCPPPPAPVFLCHFISVTIALGQHSGCPSLPAQVVCPDVTQCHGLRASLGHHCPEMGLSYLHPVHAVGTSTTGQRAFQLPHEGTSHQKRHTLLGVQPHSSPLWFDSGNLGVVGFPSRQDPGML